MMITKYNCEVCVGAVGGGEVGELVASSRHDLQLSLGLADDDTVTFT